MKEKISPIIQALELVEIYGADNLVLIDASGGNNARTNYAQKHLDSAVFMDLETELADIKDDLAMGGRHPLPDVERFCKTLAKYGITKNSHVVIYDDKNGANAAARLWWMLKAVGHEKTQVLNGGIKEAEKAGFPVNGKLAKQEKAEPYEAKNWKLPLANISEVEKISEDKQYLLIDVRDTPRFNGETEPIDLIAGHIPGATNIPFQENLNAEGLFLPPKELKAKYERIFDEIPLENIIVHCGSGVTACHTLLAMAYAGMEIPKLYVGSWSEWSRNDKPMVTLMDNNKKG